jgi:hypothetical protein
LDSRAIHFLPTSNPLPIFNDNFEQTC